MGPENVAIRNKSKNACRIELRKGAAPSALDRSDPANLFRIFPFNLRRISPNF